MRNLDEIDASTILAALHLFRQYGCPDEFQNIASAGGRFQLPMDDEITRLIAHIQGPTTGTPHNWNTGEPMDTPYGLSEDEAADARDYQIAHNHPAQAITLDIETQAPVGAKDAGYWSVSVEQEKGLPVVRGYRPGEEEPLFTFHFPAPDVTPEAEG